MAYGYGRIAIRKYRLLAMKEVTFNLTPDQLRKVAKFLCAAADQLEATAHYGPGWHVHLEYEFPKWAKEFERIRFVVGCPASYVRRNG